MPKLSTTTCFYIMYAIVSLLGICALFDQYTIKGSDVFKKELVFYMMSFACVMSHLCLLHVVALIFDDSNEQVSR